MRSEYYGQPSLRRWWWIGAGTVVVLLVALVVLRHVNASQADAGAAAPPPSYDPPAGFDAGAGTPLPREADGDPMPALLHGFDAFLALPAGLQVVDTRTGDVRAQLEPTAAPSTAGSPAVEVRATGLPPHPPVPGSVAGRAAVIAAFQVTVPGHGTTVGHDAVQLLAVGQDGYAPLATARIDLPISLDGADALREAWPVGTDGPVLVVTALLGPDRTPASYGIDLAAGRMVWQLPGFQAQALVGGVAIGSTAVALGRYQVTAVGAADGRRRWASKGPQVVGAQIWPAGPALVAVSTSDAVTGTRLLSLLDSGTGAVKATEPDQGGLTCRFDERSSTVCYRAEAGGSWVAGFDASTGKRVWQLPDPAAGRIAPRVSTAWHGTVYARTDDGTVALDARTGADRPTPPGIAPDLVDEYVGLVAATSTRPRPTAHLATS